MWRHCCGQDSHCKAVSAGRNRKATESCGKQMTSFFQQQHHQQQSDTHMRTPQEQSLILLIFRDTQWQKNDPQGHFGNIDSICGGMFQHTLERVTAVISLSWVLIRHVAFWIHIQMLGFTPWSSQQKLVIEIGNCVLQYNHVPICTIWKWVFSWLASLHNAILASFRLGIGPDDSWEGERQRRRCWFVRAKKYGGLFRDHTYSQLCDTHWCGITLHD